MYYVSLLAWCALFFYALPYLHRFWIYRFYCCFNRHSHFYQVKSYRQYYGQRFVCFFSALYLLLWGCFKGVLPFVNVLDGILLLIGAIFVLITSLDFKIHLIPLSLLHSLFGSVMWYQYKVGISFEAFYPEKLWIFLIVGIFWAICRRGMGFADFYLMLVSGLVLSLYHWLWMLLLATSCAIVYVAMLRLRGDKRVWVAFGPWLSLSSWLMFLVIPSYATY